MRRRTLVSIIGLALVAAACGAAGGPTEVATTESAGGAGAPTVVVPPPDPGLYDPVLAGERLPDDYRALLPRDAIFPVYAPTFVAAASANWDDRILVVGIELEGESRAYPIGFLNRREIVVDLHRGIPTLVTW